MTYASQGDILKLISLILPTPNDVPSAHILKHKFVNYRTETFAQHFCGCCSEPLLPGATCIASPCSGAKQQSVFVRIPLSMQIAERFEGTAHVHLSCFSVLHVSILYVYLYWSRGY